MPRHTLAVFTLLCTAVDTAWACSCLPPLPPAMALNESSAVFSGTVTAVDRSDDADEWASLVVQIDVHRIWKGSVGATVEIGTASDGAACGVHFEEGQAYLIYASASDDGHLSTNLCTRTTRMADADADIEALGDGWVPGERGAANVHLAAGPGVHVAGSPIVLRLDYRGGIDGWDGTIVHHASDGRVELVNEAFIEIARARVGQPLATQHVTQVARDEPADEPFSVLLPVTRIADLSQPGEYTVRWGIRDVAEHEVHLQVIAADTAGPEAEPATIGR